MTSEVKEKKSGALKFVINMEPGRQVELNSFIKVLKGFLGLINATEKSMTKKRAKIKWKIVAMGMGENSYFVEIQA